MNKNNVVDLKRRRQETKKQLLERLLSEHGASLQAFLRVRMRQSGQDCEDLEHDVFVRLADMSEARLALLAESDRVRSYIIKVANNLVLDIERRRQTRQHYLDTHGEQIRETGKTAISPELAAQARQHMDQVEAVLMRMKSNWRDAFILHRFGNKSYREIAAALGVSTKQVEHFIKQAVIRLNAADARIRGVQ